MKAYCALNEETRQVIGGLFEFSVAEMSEILEVISSDPRTRHKLKTDPFYIFREELHAILKTQQEQALLEKGDKQ